MTRAALIARHELRLMLGDPTPHIVTLGMPLLVLLFLGQGMAAGPEHTVPSIACLFAFLGLQPIGVAFFRDHGWRTWDRFRAGSVHPAEVVIGKLVPLAALVLLQQVVLAAAGYLVFAVGWRGGLATGGALVAALILVQLSFALLLVALCRSVAQYLAIGNLGALVVAGLGGALTPIERFPDWLAAVAPASPVYWALRGFAAVTTGASGGGAELATSLLVLLAMAVAAGGLALRFYRFDAGKQFFA